MEKKQIIAGIVSLVAAAILAILNLTNVKWFAENTAITVYPAAGLALLGLVLLFRGMFKQPKA
jgi:predicted transporter